MVLGLFPMRSTLMFWSSVKWDQLTIKKYILMESRQEGTHAHIQLYTVTAQSIFILNTIPVPRQFCNCGTMSNLVPWALSKTNHNNQLSPPTHFKRLFRRKKLDFLKYHTNKKDKDIRERLFSNEEIDAEDFEVSDEYSGSDYYV